MSDCKSTTLINKQSPPLHKIAADRRGRSPTLASLAEVWGSCEERFGQIHLDISAQTHARAMKLTNSGSVPVYTIAGASTARPLPEWLARKRKRSLKKDPEFANRIELLQDFEFEEASSCVRVSEDGDWLMSTGMRLGTTGSSTTILTSHRYLQTANTCSLFATSLVVVRSAYKFFEREICAFVVRLHKVHTSSV